MPMIKLYRLPTSRRKVFAYLINRGGGARPFVVGMVASEVLGTLAAATSMRLPGVEKLLTRWITVKPV